MDFGDLILTPLYLLFFYILFRLFRRKYHDPVLKKYHSLAFWVKMISSILFCIYYIYITAGDTYSLYFSEGRAFFRHILDDPSNIKYLFKTGVNYDFNLLNYFPNQGYLYSESNFVMIKLTAICCFFTFAKFLPINLIFAAVSFAGTWRLFLFFYELKPKLHRSLALCILFFPSVVFWSSGLLKDTLCMASIGFITYSLYKIWVFRQKIFLNLLILVIFGSLLAVVKVYILIAYLPFLVLFFALRSIGNIKIALIRIMLVPLLLLLFAGIFGGLLIKYQDVLGHYSLEQVTTSISKLNSNFVQLEGQEGAESNFNLGVDFDPSPQGLIKIAPYAIVATFFRPFIWEASKLSHLMAAVESVFLMLFTVYVLYKSRIYKFIFCIFGDPLIMYCFFFALTFGLFVGASTLNFGTLVRYKIPALPFYAIALVLTLNKLKKPDKEIEI